jgi:hypothetical protein
MRKLTCLLSLLLTISSAWADACDDLNQNLPKVLAGIDKASQATNIQELTADLIQVADGMELLKTRFTGSAELKQLIPTGSKPETWPKSCLAISRRTEVLIAEVETAGDKLEKYFGDYLSDPGVSAANDRIRKALHGD